MPPGQERGHRGQFISAKQRAKRHQNSELAKQCHAKRKNQLTDNEFNSTFHLQRNDCTESETKVVLPTNPVIPASPLAYNFLTGSRTPEILRPSIHYSPNVPTDNPLIVLQSTIGVDAEATASIDKENSSPNKVHV